MNLYHNENPNFYAEGNSNTLQVVSPSPILIPVELRPNFKTNDPRELENCIFREESFDPVSRIKRGRVYQKNGANRNLYIVPHPYVPHANMEMENGYILWKNELICFSQVNPLEAKYGINLNQSIEMGVDETLTFWKLIAVEKLLGPNDYLVTIRAMSYFGTIPSINTNVLPLGYANKILETLEKVADMAHRSGPESVIDRCRDAAASLLGAYCSQYDDKHATKDLQKLVSFLRDHEIEQRKLVLINAAFTVARLHARAKPNEQEKFNPRPITEQDGVYAIECIGMIIRELGYHYLSNTAE